MRGLFVALILASLLVFGCIGGEQPVVEEGDTVTENTSDDTTEETTEEETEEVEEADCEPSYTISELSDGIFSKGTPFVVNAECAGGKTVALYIGEQKVSEQAISTNNAAVLNFLLAPKSEGFKDIEVKVDGETIYTAEWYVAPLGSQDISGSKNEDISSRKWVAVKYHIDSFVEAKSIGAYMKRLYGNTLEDTYVAAEIRPDNEGEPGDTVLATSLVPITDTTMSYNWIWFDFPDAVGLATGNNYWVVFRIDYPELVSDTVNIHYVGEDNLAPANDYTLRNLLEWSDSEREYVETETGWQEMTYDKEFAIVISGLEH